MFNWRIVSSYLESEEATKHGESATLEDAIKDVSRFIELDRDSVYSIARIENGGRIAAWVEQDYNKSIEVTTL